MDFAELALTLFISLVLTAIIYLFIPIILCLTCRNKFTNKQIIAITIANGSILWLIFMIIRIEAGIEGTSAAVYLWSAVAYALLRKNCLKTESLENPQEEKGISEQSIIEYVEKKCEEFKNEKKTLEDFLDLCIEKRYISVSQYKMLLKKYDILNQGFSEKEDNT